MILVAQRNSFPKILDTKLLFYSNNKQETTNGRKQLLIQSKEDYQYFLEADRIALRKKHKHPPLFGEEIWKFQRLLRKAEYIQNCKSSFLSKKYLTFLRYRLYKKSVRLGLMIPRNAFGPGLSIAHYGSIHVVGKTKVGANCRINPCVTIALNGKGAPHIGDNVFIGAGAVIYGGIEIADGIAIGANSYVNKSFTEPNITIAGCPAKKVSNNGSKKLFIRATEILKSQSKFRKNNRSSMAIKKH